MWNKRLKAFGQLALLIAIIILMSFIISWLEGK